MRELTPSPELSRSMQNDVQVGTMDYLVAFVLGLGLVALLVGFFIFPDTSKLKVAGFVAAGVVIVLIGLGAWIYKAVHTMPEGARILTPEDISGWRKAEDG